MVRRVVLRQTQRNSKPSHTETRASATIRAVGIQCHGVASLSFRDPARYTPSVSLAWGICFVPDERNSSLVPTKIILFLGLSDTILFTSMAGVASPDATLVSEAQILAAMADSSDSEPDEPVRGWAKGLALCRRRGVGSALN